MAVYIYYYPLKDYLSLWGTNGIWAASLDFILFLDFSKLFVNMRLGISFAGIQIS
jgi:hypothetical protein